MQLKVQRKKFVEQIEAEFEVNIPESPFAYQLHNYRTLICVIPEWTNWQLVKFNKAEEIFRLDVTIVEIRSKISNFTISLDKTTVARILSYPQSKSSDLIEKQKIMDYIINNFNDNSISLNSFKEYYQKEINQLNGKFESL